MGWRSNEEPVGHTCPLIDQIISFIKNCEFDESDWNTSDELTKVMEDIRTANGTLRDWGNELCKTRDVLQKEVDDLQYRNDELTRDVSVLEKEIEDLKKELEEIQEE